MGEPFWIALQTEGALRDVEFIEACQERACENFARLTTSFKGGTVRDQRGFREISTESLPKK